MNAHIVVAESDADIRQLVMSILRQHGHYVLEAVDGDSALALLLNMQPDLLVLAMDLTRQNGVTVAKALHAEPNMAIMPVLLLIAKEQETAMQSWVMGGMHDYLIKPFAPYDLLARVERMLAAAHGHSERR